MGLLDVLRGRRELKPPAPDRLFAMTTAEVTLQTELGLNSEGASGIVFQALDTAEFAQIAADMQEVLDATSSESGTKVQTSDDKFGYRWMILRDSDFDDLVVGLNAVGGALQTGGFGDRILCAVFPFRDRSGGKVYWIYNYKRGTFYPFVPASGEQQRDNERELKLKAQVGPELPIEPELERWFPLWDMPI